MENKNCLFNCTDQKAKRQLLRRETPPAERQLWQYLRCQQIPGMRFRRQHGVGPYVLDFYCPAMRLAVEIDGDSHDGQEAQQYDAVRTEFLNACGIHVLRFTNAEVYQNAQNVVLQIASVMGEEPHVKEPHLTSPSERGGTGVGKPEDYGPL